MNIWGVCLVAVVVAGPAFAQLRGLPNTPDDNYALGQRFAQCSARVAFVGEIAKGAGMTDTANLAEGVSRGWKLAGMMFLVDGLAESRQPKTEEVFDSLVANKLDQLRARREINPADANATTRAEFDAECQPWAETQQKVIELMRRGN